MFDRIVLSVSAYGGAICVCGVENPQGFGVVIC
jgi:hypothetical protein